MIFFISSNAFASTFTNINKAIPSCLVFLCLSYNSLFRYLSSCTSWRMVNTDKLFLPENYISRHYEYMVELTQIHTTILSIT